MRIRHAKLSVLAISLLVASPWCLYAAGLLLSDGWPMHATAEASGEEKARLWLQLRGQGAPEVVPLGPVSYLQAAAGTSEAHASALLAWQIARAHVLKNRKVQGTWSWHCSGAAMTIWLTRNWTIDQLLSRAAELRGKSAA
jgi:hypothetical protein